MVATFTAGRRLEIGDSWREPGEPVPEAHTWFRRDDWLHTGYINETDLSAEDFRATVEQYAPDLAEEILFKAGVDDDVVLEGPLKAPRRLRELKPTVPPTALKKPKAKPKA